MPPRHFRWLVETLQLPKQGGLSPDERRTLIDMLREAEAEYAEERGAWNV